MSNDKKDMYIVCQDGVYGPGTSEQLDTYQMLHAALTGDRGTKYHYGSLQLQAPEMLKAVKPIRSIRH